MNRFAQVFVASFLDKWQWIGALVAVLLSMILQYGVGIDLSFWQALLLSCACVQAGSRFGEWMR